MTQLEFIRRYFPLANASQADYILWEMTAYPCSGLEYTEQQLGELRAKVGAVRKRGWLRKLWLEAKRLDDEMTRELREIAEERKARELAKQPAQPEAMPLDAVAAPVVLGT